MKKIKDVTKEELIDLYINQNKSQNELKEIYNCGKSAINENLKKYNIKKPIELINIKRKETCLNKYGVENASQSDEIKEKKKETCLKKYGVENPSQSDEIKDKMKKTCLKKYGVEHPFQFEEVKNKIKETCLNKYGVEYPSQSDEIKEKKKQTTLKNYGVEHPSQSDIIKEKKKKTTLNKYGVENAFQSDEIKEKIKKTTLKKYGVEHPSQSDEIKEKKKETTLKKYGVENPLQSDKIKDKMKKTMLKNYGVENPLQSDKIKDKMKKTMLKNYGVEHPLQSDKIKNKMKKTMLKNYGVENPSQSDEIKEKKKQTFLKNYGVECALQSEEVRNKSKKTCLNKYGVEHYNQRHIKNLNIWNDDKLFYKWVKNKYNELSRKVCSGDVVEFFNVDVSRALSKLHLLDDIKSSDKYYNINESYYENLITDWLKINNINYERNNRIIIKPFELDFVLSDYNIAIEMNDTWSHSVQFKMEHNGYDYLDALYYHENKLKLGKEKGYFLIHIYDKDLDNLDSIIKPILENKPDMNEINSKVYWVKGDDWVYDDDVIDLSDEGYVMVVDSNWI